MMEKSLEEVIDQPLAVLYLYTKSCPVCPALWQKIQDIMTNLPKIPLVALDAEANPALRGQLNVFAAPTILVFIEGKEALRYGANLDLRAFDQQIRRYLSLLS